MKTEWFREINGRFLLIEHGDPHFFIVQDSVPLSKITKLAKIYDQILHSLHTHSLKESYEKNHLG